MAYHSSDITFIAIKGIVAVSADLVRFRLSHRGADGIAIMQRRDYGWHLDTLNAGLNGVVKYSGTRSQAAWQQHMRSIAGRLADILDAPEVAEALANSRLLEATTAARRVALTAVQPA